MTTIRNYLHKLLGYSPPVTNASILACTPGASSLYVTPNHLAAVGTTLITPAPVFTNASATIGIKNSALGLDAFLSKNSCSHWHLRLLRVSRFHPRK